MSGTIDLQIDIFHTTNDDAWRIFANNVSKGFPETLALDFNQINSDDVVTTIFVIKGVITNTTNMQTTTSEYIIKKQGLRTPSIMNGAYQAFKLFFNNNATNKYTLNNISSNHGFFLSHLARLENYRNNNYCKSDGTPLKYQDEIKQMAELYFKMKNI